jgi:hypothetical protein
VNVPLPPFPDFCIEVPDHVVSRLVDGLAVLLDVDSGRSFSLDDVGTRAWQALTEAPNAQAALERLQEEYAAPPGILERDLMTLIDSLSAANLVQVRSLLR